ncbi:MAG: type secretion system protein GspH [Pseudomonadota bacterium]|jgi:general secretion pathway protein G
MMTAPRGFTLIELMLVIVIMSIFAGMIGLSVGGISERQVLQAREHLTDHLALIRLESVDQGRILGLRTVPQTATQAGGYAVVELDPTTSERDKRWPMAEGFKFQPLPDRVRLVVTSLQPPVVAAKPSALNDGDAPRLLWFGNGEATPVRMQLQQDEKLIGAAVYVSAMGQVSDSEQGGTP